LLTIQEDDGFSLEGTGSLLLDKWENIIAYLLEPKNFSYRILWGFYYVILFEAFQTVNEKRMESYTNIMMFRAKPYCDLCRLMTKKRT
jgi:hypothetical protein